MSGGHYEHKRKTDFDGKERNNIRKYCESAEVFTKFVKKVQEEIGKCPQMKDMCERHEIDPADGVGVHDALSSAHYVCEAIPESMLEFTGPFQLEMSISCNEKRDPHGNAFLPSPPYERNKINSLSTTAHTIVYKVPDITCVLHLWARTNRRAPDYGE